MMRLPPSGATHGVVERGAGLHVGALDSKVIEHVLHRAIGTGDGPPLTGHTRGMRIDGAVPTLQS